MGIVGRRRGRRENGRNVDKEGKEQVQFGSVRGRSVACSATAHGGGTRPAIACSLVNVIR